MKRLLIFTIAAVFSQSVFAQPTNDNCVDAELLCAGLITVGNNTDATLESCPANLGGCADDFPNFGIISSSSVWYKFTTNASGGTVTINFTNLSFNPDPNKGQALQAMLFNVPTPCQGEDFTQVSNVEVNGTGNFSINSFVLLANTTYYLIVDGKITGAAIDPADASFNIDINGPAIDITIPPTASITSAETNICEGDTELIDITISDCSDTLSMNWYYNNILIDDSTGFNTTQLSENGYLKLIIACGTVCIYRDTTDSIFFEITPIVVNAGEDFIINLGESVVLDGSGTSNPIWTPETYLSSTQTFNPTSTPEETTTYYLTVTSGSCVRTDEMIVKIKQTIIIPSGFTPNGDNTNDIWEISNISQYPNNVVKIYDRSGQLVFQTTGYAIVDNNWDGTFKNKELPISTYFYVIDLRNGGEDSVFKGPVTIIR